MKIKKRYLISALEVLKDLVLNYKCSCIGTEHCPCPRCKVAIDEAKEVNVYLSSSIVQQEDAKDEAKKKAKKSKHKRKNH